MPGVHHAGAPQLAALRPGSVPSEAPRACPSSGLDDAPRLRRRVNHGMKRAEFHGCAGRLSQVLRVRALSPEALPECSLLALDF